MLLSVKEQHLFDTDFYSNVEEFTKVTFDFRA